MRVLICLILSALFVPLAQADEWYEYIQVHCDPEQKIFEVRNITLNHKLKEDSVKTPGEIYGKRDGIEWEESENYNVIIVKEARLDIPSCIIEEYHNELKYEHEGQSYPNGIKVGVTSPLEFKVLRTSIDQGNVQRQCGAALGAAFRVFVNDEPMGYYPSKKEQCFNSAFKSNTISYSWKGIRHCESPKARSISFSGIENIKTQISVCRTGPATSYLKYLEYRKNNSKESEDLDILQTEKQEQIYAYRTAANMVHAKHLELLKEQSRNEKLSKSLEKIKQELGATMSERDNLQKTINTNQSKSFWQSLFSK